MNVMRMTVNAGLSQLWGRVGSPPTNKLCPSTYKWPRVP